MKTKLIFNSFLAKQLLLNGNQIIDLLKDHKRENGTVFVFEQTEKLNRDITRLTTVNQDYLKTSKMPVRPELKQS